MSLKFFIEVCSDMTSKCPDFAAEKEKAYVKDKKEDFEILARTEQNERKWYENVCKVDINF